MASFFPAQGARGRGYEIGFVGLGKMGWHMAKNLHLFKCPTGVWNRTTSKAEDHSAQFGTVFVSEVRDFSSPIVFCCVPTSEAVYEIAQALPADGSVKIFADCTSGNHKITKEIGQFLEKEKGIAMVDCPVSGGPAGAKSCSLTVMMGGKEEHVKTVMDYAIFAKTKQHVGPVGAGHAIKAMNNIMNTAHLMLAAEALLALSKIDISPSLALGAINRSSGRSLQTEARIPEEIFTGKYNYGFSLEHMKKDCAHAYDILKDAFPDAKVLDVVAREIRDIEVPEMSTSMQPSDPLQSGTPQNKIVNEPDYTCLVRALECRAGASLKHPAAS